MYPSDLIDGGDAGVGGPLLRRTFTPRQIDTEKPHAALSGSSDACPAAFLRSAPFGVPRERFPDHPRGIQLARQLEPGK